MTGIYAVIIKNILENKEVNLGTASGLFSKRTSALITAGILIGFMIMGGTLFFIIPGLLSGLGGTWSNYPLWILLPSTFITFVIVAVPIIVLNRRKVS